MSNPKYKPARLATLPPTLDPAEYDISPETRKAQAERLAIRSRLKREYLLQYNDPNRHGLIVSEGRWAGIRGPQWGRCAAAGGASLGAAALPEQCLGPWPAPRPREQDCSRARPPWAGSVGSGKEGARDSRTLLGLSCGRIASHRMSWRKLLNSAACTQCSYLGNGSRPPVLGGLNQIKLVTGQYNAGLCNESSKVCLCVLFKSCFPPFRSQFMVMLRSPDGNTVILHLVFLKTLWALESDSKALNTSKLQGGAKVGLLL